MTTWCRDPGCVRCGDLRGSFCTWKPEVILRRQQRLGGYTQHWQPNEKVFCGNDRETFECLWRNELKTIYDQSYNDHFYPAHLRDMDALPGGPTNFGLLPFKARKWRKEIESAVNLRPGVSIYTKSYQDPFRSTKKTVDSNSSVSTKGRSFVASAKNTGRNASSCIPAKPAESHVKCQDVYLNLAKKPTPEDEDTKKQDGGQNGVECEEKSIVRNSGADGTPAVVGDDVIGGEKQSRCNVSSNRTPVERSRDRQGDVLCTTAKKSPLVNLCYACCGNRLEDECKGVGYYDASTPGERPSQRKVMSKRDVCGVIEQIQQDRGRPLSFYDGAAGKCNPTRCADCPDTGMSKACQPQDVSNCRCIKAFGWLPDAKPMQTTQLVCSNLFVL